MKFTDLFIKRPVLATVVNLLILLIGFAALRSLNVRQYPVSDVALVTVSTIYTGASADLVRGFITAPLEKSIASADGIDYMESSSIQGQSTITVHLKLNYDPNAALTQITSKVNQVQNQLPANALVPTINVQVGDSTAAMYLSFFSKDLDSNQITDYLTRAVQPKLSAISGVQSAQILGARNYAMRAWLHPDKMAAFGISPSDVTRALAANNYLAAIGATKGAMISVNLNASTDLHTVDEFKNLIVKQSGNTIIRLKDIADVVLGAQNYDTTVQFGGQNATFMGINVLPTANPLDVVKAVRKIFPEIQDQLPAGIQAAIPYDSTIYIQDSINEVAQTLLEALVIVIIVIYLFLGSFRIVFIPIVTIPLSMIGAGIFMAALGFTINLLTLLAMVLAIGLVVDDAIIVVENIHRHLEEGLSPLEASLKGARELGSPIIAMTITLAAVYAPIAFQGGLTGTLFKEFALTLVGAVVISGIVALTLSPMMCSKLLRLDASKHGFVHWLDTTFDKIRHRYQKIVAVLLEYWLPMLAIPLTAIILIPILWMFTAKELAPTEDQGIIISASNAAPDASLDQTMLYTKQVTDIFKSFPETENIFQINGASGGGAGAAASANTAITGMVLKPWSERKRSQDDLLPLVQAKLGNVAGLQSFAFTRPPLPGAGDTRIQFVIGSTKEPIEIYNYANKIMADAMKSGKFVYADSDLKYDQPQVVLNIDRDKAATFGINMQDLSNDIGTMLGGNYINYFSIQGQSYQVIPQVTRLERLNPSQIEDYYVSTASGKLVPLSTFVSLTNIVQPERLNRFQQLNSASLTLMAKPGVVTEGQAIDYLNTLAKSILPKDYSIDYGGSARQFVQESGGLVLSMVFAFIIIFLVLAAQFESFRDPLIILFGSVPMTLMAALVVLFLGIQWLGFSSHLTLNIYTEVGLITLIGLIAKHGILIVQFANQLQLEGRTKREAIEEAAAVRLRPILMTTAAMVFGVVPLLIAGGPGAASRLNIGIVVFTGMAIGTVFTLFVLPAVYLFIADDLHAKEKAAEKSRATTDLPPSLPDEPAR